MLTVVLLLKVLHLVIIASITTKVKSWSLSLLSIAVSFTLFDAGFMFVSRSFGTGYPLADQNWVRKHWNPINKQGYRAPELNARLFDNKKNVLVVGSSYTAGDGIDEPEQRFTNKLDAKLPDGFAVHNLGLCGSEALDAYKRLTEYEIEPDVIILAHTIKSIKALIDPSKAKIPSYRLDEEINPLAGFLVKNSYIINYAFWKFYAPEHLKIRYLSNLDTHPISLYLDREKLKRHLNNLNKFVNYCEHRSIPLIVVSFPSLTEHMERTVKVVTNPIEHYFFELDVTTVSVFDLVRDLSVEERTVNSTDAHPSIEVHSRIADELFAILEGKGLI